MSAILLAVTDVESKVVDTVRSIQGPVVGTLRKGVELADGRVPRLAYPASLPKPGEVIDSQFDFVRALLDAQHDLVRALVDTVAPLAGADVSASEPTSAASTSTGAAKSKSAKNGKTARSGSTATAATTTD